jgi:hypothetical protein
MDTDGAASFEGALCGKQGLPMLRIWQHTPGGGCFRPPVLPSNTAAAAAAAAPSASTPSRTYSCCRCSLASHPRQTWPPKWLVAPLNTCTPAAHPLLTPCLQSTLFTRTHSPPAARGGGPTGPHQPLFHSTAACSAAQTELCSGGRALGCRGPANRTAGAPYHGPTKQRLLRRSFVDRIRTGTLQFLSTDGVVKKSACSPNMSSWLHSLCCLLVFCLCQL